MDQRQPHHDLDQPATNSRRHRGHQSQNLQSNSAGSYAGGIPVGTSNSYGQPNQQPVSPSQDHQQQGYISNTPMVDPYAHSSAGPEGGSAQTLPNPPEFPTGDRTSARMPVGRPVVPPLQQSHSSRLGGSASGHEWDASHQPPHVRPGNDVQEQHRYPRVAPVQPHARDTPGSSGFPRSSNNICRIRDCRQLGFFNPHTQEQLDYCEAHLAYTGLGGHTAIACKGCGGRLQALENSEYCSRLCAGGGRSAAIVPQGFAPACQECRRAITENMQIFGGHFCSLECWNANRTAHPSRR